MASKESDYLQTKVQAGTGWVFLNRPQSLNALSFDMVCGLQVILDRWKNDAAVTQVVIAGTGRAFCAGGDIRAFHRLKTLGEADEIDAYFRAEYRLNETIGHYPKPYISLLTGITMGGGMGISIHGSHRIVHPEATFAMPEVLIGFFPDAGATYFLQKCPGQIGRYLGLTGETLQSADGMYAGFGTHYVPAEKWDAFVAALATGLPVDPLLAQYQEAPPVGTLSARRDLIDTLFCGDDFQGMMQGLESSQDPWVQDVHTQLLTRSPTSLRVTFAHQQRAVGKSLSLIMALELALSDHFVWDHDFEEGVRARLVDKDNNPDWQPAHWSGVSDKTIDRYMTLPE